MKSHTYRNLWIAVAILIAGPAAGPAHADDAGVRLAKQVANPLASLISVPVQYNLDGGIGPGDVTRSTINLQPVVPFGIGGGTRWKVISRTIVPLVVQNATGPVGELSGVGDVTQSWFVTRPMPTVTGWTVGAGPVVQAPTGSETRLTTDRWSVGPTAIALRQAGPWTYGALANHVWSVGGDGARTDVSATFVQPFVNYVTRTRTTFALNTEATRDWSGGSWSVPVHVIVNQLVKLGPQPASAFVGARWWAASPDQGPEGWGLRAGINLLFVPSRPGDGHRAQ